MYKSISLYFAMLTLFSSISCIDNTKSTELDKQYPQKSTEFIEYKVTVDTKLSSENLQSRGPEIFSDEIFANYINLGLGLERKKITTEIKSGKFITTTETWTRKKLDDPWLPAKVIAGIGITATIIGIVAYQAYEYYQIKYHPIRYVMKAHGDERTRRIENIVKSGVNVNTDQDFLQKNLMEALAMQSSDNLEALIKVGADINAIDTEGRTVLMHAITSEYDEDLKITMLQELYSRGANPDLVDNLGKTAVDYAKETGSTKILDFFPTKQNEDKVNEDKTYDFFKDIFGLFK